MHCGLRTISVGGDVPDAPLSQRQLTSPPRGRARGQGERVGCRGRNACKKKNTLLGVLITVCSICLPRVANKRIFLMPYGITLLYKDEKFALCKPSVCAGSRAGKTRNKKTRIPNGILAFLWSGLRGSNPPPSPWQGDALPNELNPHFLVPPVGIEPTTRGFSVPCSTN